MSVEEPRGAEADSWAEVGFPQAVREVVWEWAPLDWPDPVVQTTLIDDCCGALATVTMRDPDGRLFSRSFDSTQARTRDGVDLRVRKVIHDAQVEWRKWRRQGEARQLFEDLRANLSAAACPQRALIEWLVARKGVLTLGGDLWCLDLCFGNDPSPDLMIRRDPDETRALARIPFGEWMPVRASGLNALLRGFEILAGGGTVCSCWRPLCPCVASAESRQGAKLWKVALEREAERVTDYWASFLTRPAEESDVKHSSTPECSRREGGVGE